MILRGSKNLPVLEPTSDRRPSDTLPARLTGLVGSQNAARKPCDPVADLPPDRFSCLQQRLDRGGERRLPIDELVGSRRNVSTCAAQSQARGSRAILGSGSRDPVSARRAGTAAEKSPNGLAIEIFDANLFVPPHWMMRAMPTASLRSLLLICMFGAALACRASIQMTGSPNSRV